VKDKKEEEKKNENKKHKKEYKVDEDAQYYNTDSIKTYETFESMGLQPDVFHTLRLLDCKEGHDSPTPFLI
jgi:hypothetical protein